MPSFFFKTKVTFENEEKLLFLIQVVWASGGSGPKPQDGKNKISEFINFRALKKLFNKAPAY